MLSLDFYAICIWKTYDPLLFLKNSIYSNYNQSLLFFYHDLLPSWSVRLFATATALLLLVAKEKNAFNGWHLSCFAVSPLGWVCTLFVLSLWTNRDFLFWTGLWSVVWSMACGLWFVTYGLRFVLTVFPVQYIQTNWFMKCEKFGFDSVQH